FSPLPMPSFWVWIISALAFPPTAFLGHISTSWHSLPRWLDSLDCFFRFTLRGNTFLSAGRFSRRSPFGLRVLCSLICTSILHGPMHTPPSSSHYSCGIGTAPEPCEPCCSGACADGSLDSCSTSTIQTRSFFLWCLWNWLSPPCALLALNYQPRHENFGHLFCDPVYSPPRWFLRFFLF